MPGCSRSSAARSRWRMTRPNRASGHGFPRRSCFWRRTRPGIMNLMQLNTRLYIDGAMSGAANLPQVTLDELAATCRGPDLPDRRTGRPLGPVPCRRPARQGPRAPGAVGRDLPRPALCRAAAPPRPRRTACRRPRRWPNAARWNWPMRCACRWSPRTTSISPRPRCTRRMTR